MFETNRCLVRRFQPKDLSYMRTMESDPEVMKYTSFRIPQKSSDTIDRFNRLLKEQNLDKLGVWGAFLRNGGDFVGWFMLKNSKHDGPEIGFMINPNYQNMGYATEVSIKLINHALDLGYNTIYAVIDPNNSASLRVIGKLGFFKRQIQDDGLELYQISLGQSDE